MTEDTLSPSQEATREARKVITLEQALRSERWFRKQDKEALDKQRKAMQTASYDLEGVIGTLINLPIADKQMVKWVNGIADEVAEISQRLGKGQPHLDEDWDELEAERDEFRRERDAYWKDDAVASFQLVEAEEERDKAIAEVEKLRAEKSEAVKKTEEALAEHPF